MVKIQHSGYNTYNIFIDNIVVGEIELFADLIWCYKLHPKHSHISDIDKKLIEIELDKLNTEYESRFT